jgi:hypothetical protein
MDLPVIVAHLDRRRISAPAIHNNIVVTLERNIVGYTVPRHLREATFHLSTDEASNAHDRKPIEDADEANLSALNDSPFASVRQLSRPTHLHPMIVYHCLTQSTGFTARHLRWVPHALSDAQKA